jgi:hypothetical protein
MAATSKLKDSKWTLVQHSAFSGKGDYQFRYAVEEALIERDSDIAKVVRAGGLIFHSYLDASGAEYKENYPPEVQGLTPHVRGTFASLEIDGRKVYIPKREGEVEGR